MKILQVINFFKPSWEAGGPTRASYEISANLVKRGHSVTVYATDGFKHRLKVEKNTPVNVDGIRTYYFRNLSNYLARTLNFPIPYYAYFVMRKEVKDYDVIHIHEHRTMLAVLASHYAKKHNVPYVIQARGSILPFFQRQGLKKIFDSLFGYRILKNASRVIALTKVEEEQYLSMGVPKEKILIIPNGINLEAYKDLPAPGEFRRKHSIKPGEKVILYLGRIHPVKGVDLLVQAFASLCKRMENVRLVIVGPDDGFLPEVQKLIDGLGVRDKTLVTGPLYGREKLEAYVDSDVYALPSRYEAFANTILEAWACGLPVVVTDHCCIADIVEHNTGCVTPCDSSRLADALYKVLNDAELADQFRKKGKTMVSENFDIGKIILDVEKMYVDMIDKQSSK